MLVQAKPTPWKVVYDESFYSDRSLKVSWRWLDEKHGIAEFCYSLRKKHTVSLAEIFRPLASFNTPFYEQDLREAVQTWVQVPVPQAGFVEFTAVFRR